MDDKDIIALYQKRDENAIAYTKEKYSKSLYSLSYGILKSKENAEECENDTYLNAWNSIPPKDPTGYFYAYLMRITRNLSLNRIRQSEAHKRKMHICQLSAEAEQLIPAKETTNQALAEDINRFLSGLSTEKRKIFVRRYFFLESIEDIAKFYGISQSKVKTTLFRLRNELKDFLEKEEYTL